MRKVVLKRRSSLDGYVRAASGDVMDWVFRSYADIGLGLIAAIGLFIYLALRGDKPDEKK